jgi:hypothetical protein
LASVNALLGMLFVHTDYQAVSLDPESPKYVDGTVTRQYGDTTYYTIPTANLPLLQPLRDLGVPEALMALVQPALRVIIETAYDRTINPGIPTAARLIPRIDPVRFVEDFIAAVGQGIADARDEIVNPTPRPAGPTPTERVLTDLVRTNVDHTIAGVRGATATTDSETTDVDVTDGDVADGDATDADVTDGDVVGGDFTDGDVTDAPSTAREARAAKAAWASTALAERDSKRAVDRGSDRTAQKTTGSERGADKPDRDTTSDRGADKPERTAKSGGRDSTG